MVVPGWMVSTLEYENLALALRDRGVELRVSARRYRTAHELPVDQTSDGFCRIPRDHS